MSGGEHWRAGEPELGCAYLIFLALDLVAAVVCLWAVMASGNHVLTLLGLAGLFGVIVSAGSIFAGVGDWPERRP